MRTMMRVLSESNLRYRSQNQSVRLQMNWILMMNKSHIDQMNQMKGMILNCSE